MQIVKAIDTADSFVLKLSPTAAESVNVRKELNLAEDSPDPFVLPVLLAEVKIPAEMRYQLAGTQWIEYYLDPDNKYRQLEETLIERRAQKTTPPPTHKETEIVIKGAALADFDDEMKAKLLAFLAENTGASIEDLAVTRVEAGSLRIFVKMPADPAYELKAMALNNDQRLIDAGITGIRFVGDKNIIPVSSTPAPTTGASSLTGKLVVQIIGGIVGVAAVAALVYGALNLPFLAPGETATPTPTTAAPTSTATPEPSATPSITSSNTPTLTPTGTATPTITPTSTPTTTVCPPVATVLISANCRTGPGSDYPEVVSLAEGQGVTVVGRNTDSSWWVVENHQGFGTCWVWGELVSLSTDTCDVPIVVAPPPPTPTLTPTTTPTPTPPEDTIPPPVPMPITPEDGAWFGQVYSVTLNWTEVNDESGIATYDVVLESSKTAEDWQPDGFYSTSTNSIEVPVKCGGYYFRWAVRAEDGAGNLGDWSSFSIFGVDSACWDE